MSLGTTEVIAPGDKVEIYFVDKNNNDVYLDTVIYDIISENEFLINNPVKDGKLYLISMDMKVTFVIKKDTFGVIAFTVFLVQRKKVGNIYTISCNIVSEFKKQQRRNYFRMKIYEDVNIWYMTDVDGKQIDYYIFDPDIGPEIYNEIKVSVNNISGGGISLRSKVSFNLGTFVYSNLEFLNSKIEITGIVVRCDVSRRYENEYDIGVSFDDVGRDVIRKITSYVFSSQQKKRRKE